MPRIEYFYLPEMPLAFELAEGIRLDPSEFRAAAAALITVAATGACMFTDDWRTEALPHITEVLEFNQILPPRSNQLAAALVTERGCSRIGQRLGYFSRSQKTGEPPTIGSVGLHEVSRTINIFGTEINV